MIDMQSILFCIVASSCVGIFIADLSGIMETVKRFTRHFWYTTGPRGVKWPRRLKPFDCSLCLSFWICLYLVGIIIPNQLSVAIGSACVASVLSVWMLKQVRK